MSIIKTHPTGFYQYNSNSQKDFARAQELSSIILEFSRGIETPDAEVYSHLLNITDGGNLQTMEDLSGLLGNLSILLASIPQKQLESTIDIPSAQRTLTKLRDMFIRLAEDRQTNINLIYHALLLHPDCVDPKRAALMYYRTLSKRPACDIASASYQELITKIQTEISRSESYY